MSNASNLSTLANVLDDGSSGQFLKSTGSGGVAFDTVAAGAVVYATADLLPLSGNSAGDMAYVTATNRFYINNGSGWYSISLVNTNPSITSVADASSGTTPFTLATDQTATVITITAADPEEVPLTYGYSVTSGSLNGSTVVQGTGSNTNVFTVTPHASQDATFTLTFTASDGINQATSANAFSLSFVTIVADSNHTTLLATATGTSDNNNITDSSSNSHSITVNGDAHAGTFSPYRSGGYSTYFDGTGDYLQLSSGLPEGAFTASCWAYFNNSTNDAVFSQGTSSNSRRTRLINVGSYIRFYIGSNSVGSSTTSAISLKTWYYIEVQYSGSQIELFINGTSAGTTSNTLNPQNTNFHVGSLGSSWSSSNDLDGYVSDLKIVSGTPSGSSTVPTEPISSSGSALHICHLPYIADGSTNAHSITANGDVSTKPFSPYDYNEYSATYYGGSVYFDGSGDYLTTTSSNYSLGTGSAFTLEFWYYFDESRTHTVFDFYNSSNAAVGKLAFTSANVYLYDGSANILSITRTQAVGAWEHFCWTRDASNNHVFYINGTQVGTSTASTNIDSQTLNFGRRGGSFNSTFMKGYLSDISLTKGSVTRTSAFIPPTTPLSSSGTTLHIKGTDASIIDKSQGSNLKLIGDTTGSTTQVKFSNTKSMYFDGNSDYIEGPTVSDLNIGTGDFTVECWLYETTNNAGIWDSRSSGAAADGFTVSRLSSGNYRVWGGSVATTSALLTSSSTITLNSWVHLALVRNNGTLKIYINGTSSSAPSSVSNSTNFSNSGKFLLGGGKHNHNSANPSIFINGYIQDFRVSNNARYTANFTPPTAPLEG